MFGIKEPVFSDAFVAILTLIVHLGGREGEVKVERRGPWLGLVLPWWK